MAAETFKGEIHSDVPWFDRHFQIDLIQGLGIQNQPMVSTPSFSLSH